MAATSSNLVSGSGPDCTDLLRECSVYPLCMLWVCSWERSIVYTEAIPVEYLYSVQSIRPQLSYHSGTILPGPGCHLPAGLPGLPVYLPVIVVLPWCYRAGIVVQDQDTCRIPAQHRHRKCRIGVLSGHCRAYTQFSPYHRHPHRHIGAAPVGPGIVRDKFNEHCLGFLIHFMV